MPHATTRSEKRYFPTTSAESRNQGKSTDIHTRVYEAADCDYIQNVNQASAMDEI